MFMKVLNVVLTQTNFPATCKVFKELPDENLFVIFVNFVKKDMNRNVLAKKIIAWFNENEGAHKERDFGFRFRGRESYNYLCGFPFLIKMLKSKVNSSSFYRLVQVFYESIYLRKIISYSVRIEDLVDFDFQEMIDIGRCLFKCCSLYDTSVSPSLWTFAVASPHHCIDYVKKLGMGLGINTMEGREQKHQQIHKYAHNTTVQERWPYIFRHEFIQLIYLRENGFDCVKYRKRNTSYLPEVTDGYCECSLKLAQSSCEICDSREMKKLLLSLK